MARLNATYRAHKPSNRRIRSGATTIHAMNEHSRMNKRFASGFWANDRRFPARIRVTDSPALYLQQAFRGDNEVKPTEDTKALQLAKRRERDRARRAEQRALKGA